MEHYLFMLKAARRSADYLKLNRSAIGGFSVFVGPDTPIETITRDQVRRWSLDVQSRCEASTARVYLQQLGMCFRALIDDEVLVSDPTARVKLPRATKREPRVFRSHEVQALLNATNTERSRMLIYLLNGTGIRITEAVELRWETVEADRIKVMGKGRKERSVPIGEALSGRLATWRQDAPGASTVLGLTRGKAERILHQIGGEARVPDVHPHAFRHTFGTECVKAGIPLPVVSRWMGHTNIKTTKGLFCSKRCMGLANRGDGNPNYRHGRRTKAVAAVGSSGLPT